MAIRKVQDVNSQRVTSLTQLGDFPTSITANTYLRGNAAATALEFSNIVPQFTGWFFTDTNAGILSFASGSLFMGATGTFTIQAAITDVSTGQLYANAGMLIGAPAANARNTGFAVEVADLPGVYFRNSAPNDGGWITMENAAAPNIHHRFGINGTPYVGDFRHTDLTNYCRYDASAGLFTVESADGVPEVSLNGANGDVTLTGELMGARVTESAGNRSIVAGTTSGYLSSHLVAHSSTTGLVMPRAGSIVGLAGMVLASGHAGTGNMTFEARINNTVVFSTVVSVTGNGVFKSVSTQARGTDTFAASDLLQLSWTNAGTYAKDSVLLTAELQFDT